LQKRILCYGDSNTYGYIPTGGRYDEHTRWPMRMQALLGNGYAVIENPTGEVTVDLIMKPLLIQSNPEIYENNGKAAVCYGPFVCAGESVDNTENLHSIFIDKNFQATAQYDDTLCGYTLKVKAYRRQATQALYCAYEENFENYILHLIPYAAFANRGESNMCVWFGVR
jgi:DUF1680 family protein